MNFSSQLILWREHQALSQQALAEKTDLTRAYLSRLEGGKGDPSLSVLRRLAAALGLSIGAFLDEVPSRPSFTREELDQLARAVYHPTRKENKKLPYMKILAQAYRGRRAALGLYRPRHGGKKSTAKLSTGRFALHRLRLILGEETWHALLKRIDKHAAFQGNPIS